MPKLKYASLASPRCTLRGLFLCFTAIIFLTGCKVTKQIQKSDTENESQTKVDSSVVEKKDVTKESKIESVVTEVIDTTVHINTKGEVVTDTTGQKTTAVKVKKTKTTKTVADIRETDKTQTKVEVKKKAEVKEETATKGKVIEKSGVIIPWYWYLILLLILAAYLFYRFYLRKFLK